MSSHATDASEPDAGQSSAEEPLTDPAVWRRTRKVFDAVVSLAPGAREARLTELCRDAPELRREVESLLAHAGVSDASLASVVSSAARDAADEETLVHEGQALLLYDAGHREYGYLERDPIFAPFRGDQRFRSLLEPMRRDVEAQRQAARERGLLDLDALLTPPGRP